MQNVRYLAPRLQILAASCDAYSLFILPFSRKLWIGSSNFLIGTYGTTVYTGVSASFVSKTPWVIKDSCTHWGSRKWHHELGITIGGQKIDAGWFLIPDAGRELTWEIASSYGKVVCGPTIMMSLPGIPASAGIFDNPGWEAWWCFFSRHVTKYDPFALWMLQIWPCYKIWPFHPMDGSISENCYLVFQQNLNSKCAQ